MDYALVVGILVLIEGFIILRGLIELSRQIESGLEELDTNLAAAIATVVENLMKNFGGGDFEPVNPIQQAIAGFIQNKMNENNAIEVVSRSADGKFSPADN